MYNTMGYLSNNERRFGDISEAWFVEAKKEHEEL